MEHLFDVEIAKKYGVNAAVVLRHLQFWIIKNKTHNTHLHDGRTWTYYSVSAFTKIFPYLTKKQVRRALDLLIEKGVILKGNYNQRKNDTTNWYAFVDEKRFAPEGNENNLACPTGQAACPTGQTDMPHRANGVDLQGKLTSNPIQNGYTNKSTKSNGLISSEKRLELDLQIAKEVKFFAEQVIGTEQNPGIFRYFTIRETQTFKRITFYLVEQCQAGKLPVSIFKNAVEWAMQAKSSMAANKKGLFVAKIKQKTGFKKQEKLLNHCSNIREIVNRSNPIFKEIQK